MDRARLDQRFIQVIDSCSRLIEPPEACIRTRRNHQPHIGIVSHLRSPGDERPLVVHNIGRGPVIEDALFDYP